MQKAVGFIHGLFLFHLCPHDGNGGRLFSPIFECVKLIVFGKGMFALREYPYESG